MTLGVAVTVVMPTPAAHAEETVTETSARVAATPEPDGSAVDLDVSVFSTDPSQARPAIVLAHGFGGSKADSATPARTLARDGYTVITFTSRGFGSSGGRIHLNSEDFEGDDAVRLIDFAASRPEVAKEGADPVIGFAGGSYGGAVALLAASLDQRVDAIAPAFTWHSLTQALFPQYAVTQAPRSLADVESVNTTGVFKQRWAALFFLSGGGAGPGRGAAKRDPEASLCGRFDPDLCEGYLDTAETSEPSTELIALLDQLTPNTAAISSPTLLIHGEQDTLFPLDQADATFTGLPQTTPAKMSWVAGGHDGEIDIDDLLPEMESWFDRYLKQDGSLDQTAFSVVVPETALVGDGDGTRDPDVITLPGYPGRTSALTVRGFGLKGEEQTMVSPPGGAPAALTNLPGTGGALSALSGVGGYGLGVLPEQSVTFVTEPVTEPVVLLGSGTVELQVTSSTPTASLFASLWDLGPDLPPPSSTAPANRARPVGPSTAVLPQLAVAPIRLIGLTPDEPAPLRVTLPPVAHQVPVGHRLQLVVSSTDQAYAVPKTAAVYTVSLAGDRALRLPQVDTASLERRSLNVSLPLVIVVGTLLLAALAGTVAFLLRRRAAHARADLADRPLVVENVAKTYQDGFKAVDGVSFVAETGQVVGLLGPNGAGKTTVMRMLVGLIRPDSGMVYVSGQPVHAGADVLLSVGSFIEGPGFLPHLSGMENLLAYWRATGRPLPEAHLDEALDIAGLGSAIDRTVRGYSQGMRQRLGIAQAMLGLPSLLLLDEPTNGLDPPQIKAMRTVLADYAASGRTVVVSSHLLSEVEQTCTHVVVMHLGQVILTGAIDELTATDDVTVVSLAAGSDLTAAAEVLRSLPVRVTVESEALRVEGHVTRGTVVAKLVQAGLAIESVDGRRQLEEVFMGLVTTPSGASNNSHGGADD